jgi:Na+-driven multidrug efflux pump
MLWINFAGSVFCLILILVTDLLLIPWLGINGAAIANTISYLGSALFNIYFFTKYTGLQFSHLFRFSSEDWKWPGNKLAS